jgi:myo-inositol-1(or 4)-monophosphatase
MTTAAQDLDLIAAAARRAGQRGLELAASGYRKWEKSPGNPVTDADMELDRLLSDHLRAERPAYGWLSEEREDDRARLDCDRAFLVDPIDGTRDFTRGRPGWCVSIAVVEAGEPIAAAIYQPPTDLLFTAGRGGGAFRNGEPIHVSNQRDLAGARLPVDADMLRSKHWQGPRCVSVSKPNSIALRMAMIADGTADAMFDGRESRELDIAAAVLIVTEAGGVTSDTEGLKPHFNKPIARERNLIVAATPQLHEQMRLEAKGMLERRRADRERRRGG